MRIIHHAVFIWINTDKKIRVIRLIVAGLKK